MEIWRPDLADSADGAPLVTSVRTLFLGGFPYERLPSNRIVAFFLRPESVLGLLCLYLGSKPLFRQAAHSVQPESASFRGAVALHNLALAVFSCVCASNSWRLVLRHLDEAGWMAVYCDRDGSLWRRGGLGAWSLVFYISKYYEFVDTWILLLKGKDASFLQVYHHTGIAFIMWCAVASQSAWLLFVVLLNSVIHTLMYTYFFIKTISPKTELKAARYLTMAQIGQFIIGLSSTFGVLVMGEKCDTESSRFALACLQLYGYGLIALFFAFAKRKYKKS
jgi:GNS1/SUR4 family